MAQAFAKAFYEGRQWKQCRCAFMKSNNYICDRCGGLATIVHHKTHITVENIHNQDVTLNWNNLQPLCIECHNAVHGNAGTATAEGISFDTNGNVVYNKPDEPGDGQT